MHEGKKTHVCNICGKSFIQDSHLKRHKKTVHEGELINVSFVTQALVKMVNLNVTEAKLTSLQIMIEASTSA